MNRFCLTINTPPEWAALAERHLDIILLDHAHCEKRAASTALNFIFRYPDVPGLVPKLTALAREELLHFSQVQAWLEERHLPFEKLSPSSYAERLVGCARKKDPHRLVDRLLAAALIEARSCERFEVLADGLKDRQFAERFRRLAKAEARHYQDYLDLAQGLTEEDLSERLAWLAAQEGQIVKDAGQEPRLHNDLGVFG